MTEEDPQKISCPQPPPGTARLRKGNTPRSVSTTDHPAQPAGFVAFSLLAAIDGWHFMAENLRFGITDSKSQITNPQFASAICNLQSAICNLQSAICNLQSAICNLQSAICDLRSAICDSARRPAHPCPSGESVVSSAVITVASGG
jgi:hypothetical protein